LKPRPVPLPGLPERVEIYEVGPRDGLQNEAAVLPPETKLALIKRLVAAGLRNIEVTSMVRADAVPQLADAEEVLRALPRVPGVRYTVLVPNMRGLERALAAGATDVAVFASATESFAKHNLASSRAEAMARYAKVAATAQEAGLTVRGYVSMCFGDPWEGDIEPAEVAAVVNELLAMGCREVSLGDTIGVATPGAVHRLIGLLAGSGTAPGRLAVHFHDTYGQALANTVEALRLGITTVDSSAGGLGGCPSANSRAGNLATEDLVFALDGLGIRHGADIYQLAGTSIWLAGVLGRPSPSRAVQALASELSTREGRPWTSN
jgi:hydroxymethylglutaryl-CoA lyase